MRVLIYTGRYTTNSKEKCRPPEAKSSSPSHELASTYRTRKCNTVFTIAHHFNLILGHSNPVHHPILFPAYPSYYYIHIYAYFFQVISVFRGSPPKACMYLFSPPYGPHGLSLSFFLIWWPELYIFIYIIPVLYIYKTGILPLYIYVMCILQYKYIYIYIYMWVCVYWRVHMTKLLIMNSPPPRCYQVPVVQISSSAP